MGRWEPGARERLQAAALDLYLDQGFDRTTVTEIAARAGLTERTFYRHFADKREVLFDGSATLQDRMVAAVAAAPAGASTLEVVRKVLDAAAELFPPGRQDWSRRRQETIVATPSLTERELLKLAGLGVALAGAFAVRGMPDAQAALVAETTVTVFRVGFDRWRAGPDGVGLAEAQHAALDDIRALVGS